MRRAGGPSAPASRSLRPACLQARDSGGAGGRGLLPPPADPSRPPGARPPAAYPAVRAAREERMQLRGLRRPGRGKPSRRRRPRLSSFTRGEEEEEEEKEATTEAAAAPAPWSGGRAERSSLSPARSAAAAASHSLSPHSHSATLPHPPPSLPFPQRRSAPSGERGRARATKNHPTTRSSPTPREREAGNGKLERSYVRQEGRRRAGERARALGAVLALRGPPAIGLA